MMRTPIAAALAAVDTFRNFSSRHAARTKRETLGALLVLLLLAAAQMASAQTFTPRIAVVNGGLGGAEAGQTGNATAGDEITVRFLVDVEGASNTDGSDSYVYGTTAAIEFIFTSSSSPAASTSAIDGWTASMINGFSAEDADDYRPLHDDRAFTNGGSAWTETGPATSPFNFRLIVGDPEINAILVIYVDDGRAGVRGAWCIPSGGNCTIAVGDFTFTLPSDMGAGTLELVYSVLGDEDTLLLGIADGPRYGVPIEGATVGTPVAATYTVAAASELTLDAPSDQYYSVGTQITPPTFSPAVGGTVPYTYNLEVTDGNLPAGLTLTAGGPGTLPALDGTPTEAGTATLTYSVTDSATLQATVSRTFTVTVSPVVDVCSRTEQVRDEILSRIGGATPCDAVTALQLSEVAVLRLEDESITGLQAGDFSGLGSLEALWLNGNQLTTLPAEVFRGLTNLGRLELYDNQLTGLPSGVFSGLDSLVSLYLFENQLTDLPSGVFSGLGNLEQLGLWGNQLTDLPAEVFRGLASLEELFLSENQLSALPDGVFSGLASLEWLTLDDNQLSTLPSGVFNGLGSLEFLDLGNNPFTRVPAGVVPPSVTTLLIDLTPVGMLPPSTVATDASVDVSAAFISSGGSDGARMLTYTVASSAAAVVTATVTAAGIVRLTPVAAGDATVTVTADDGANTATQGIAVKVIDASSVNADLYVDGTLDHRDALVMYYSYAPAFRRARAEMGATLDSILGSFVTPAGQAAGQDANDLVTNAEAFRDSDQGPDLYADDQFDHRDALVMYYSYAPAFRRARAEMGATLESILGSFVTEEEREAGQDANDLVTEAGTFQMEQNVIIPPPPSQ